MKKVEMAGLFALAGIPVLRVWQLPNGYFPIGEDEDDERTIKEAVYRARRPWWLVKTARGCIEIGWRKRVISIDWSDTTIRQKMTEDKDVTSYEHYCHAWSVEKALEYLKALAPHLTPKAKQSAAMEHLAEKILGVARVYPNTIAEKNHLIIEVAKVLEEHLAVAV